MRLGQHVSQISFLLMGIKRPDPEEPKGEMGFHATCREFVKQESEAESKETEAEG